MRATLAKMETEVSELDYNEKIHLLEKLLLQTGSSIPPEIEALWEKEAVAREAAVVSGKLKTIPWEKVKAEAKKLL